MNEEESKKKRGISRPHLAALMVPSKCKEHFALMDVLPNRENEGENR